MFGGSSAHGLEDHCYCAHDVGMDEFTKEEDHWHNDRLEGVYGEHLFTQKDVYRVVDGETVFVENTYVRIIEIVLIEEYFF